MQTLEKVLADLYKKGECSYEDAIAKTSKPEELQRLIGGGAAPTGAKPAH
jgi:twitching motility protein PilT